MQSLAQKTLPRAMREPPSLPPPIARTPVPRTALLVNPFYPKGPARELRQARADADAGAHLGRCSDSRADWQVRYWDENLLQGSPPIESVPAVVGITVHLTFAQRAYRLARWFREHGSTVVLGGLHVISCPDECAPHADALAIGDGVSIWPRILADHERGALRSVYRADFDTPYRNDPAPRRDLLPRDAFLTTTSLIATRGCHNRCGFCYLSTDGLRMPYRMRDVEQVVDEIVADGQPYVVFTDNNLGSRRDYLLRLCRALEPLGIIWSAAVTIDVTDDREVVEAMGRSGLYGRLCRLRVVGLGQPCRRPQAHARPDDYGRRVRLLHDHGIQVNGSFVLGFDHDDASVFARTVAWIEQHKLECATFHIMTPYPGTPLFAQMEREGRLLHRDWSRYDTAHVVFRPARMSVGELERGYSWCYQRLFSHASIWRRRPDAWSAVPAYLASSYLYKRSNWLWHQLIRRSWTARAWRPLVEANRRRHLRARRRAERSAVDSALCVPPGA